MSEGYQQRVVCAAVRFGDQIIASARHYDKLMHDSIRARDRWESLYGSVSEQGFIDQRGNFLTRHEAWVVAEAAGQILRRCGSDGLDGMGLFSENLY